MKTYEIIEHTADIGLRAFGNTRKEAFENAAAGMFSLITDLDTITGKDEYRVEVEAEDGETLLVEWLNELLYLYDSHGVLLKRFAITELGETHLTGLAYGEAIDRGRHQLDADIKAVTYYMLKVENTAEGWVVEVIFDV